MSAPAGGSRGWLFGPSSDLLLGCGLGSIAVIALQAGAGRQLMGWVPGPLLILLFAVPHYGATLLRVYEDPADRRKYRLFAAIATAVVGTAFVASLELPWVGSLVLTVYLTWSPWHYTGQNYGITLMLLGRRGVTVSPLSKRLLHATFVLSFALTLLAIHGERPQGAAYAPVNYGGTVFTLLPLGIPHALVGNAIVVLGAAYLVTLGVVLVRLFRAGGFAGVAPATLLIFTQALWFSLPVPIRYFDLAPESSVFRSVYTAYGFLWIAAFHSLQYLWITTYFATEARGADEARAPLLRRGIFLGKAALLGFAVWTLPALAFAPGALGSLPQESGLSLMVAAVVNLHHFLLDGAIWKLRDGRVARILLASGAPEPEPEPATATPRLGAAGWTRRVVYGLGALSLGYGALAYSVGDLGFAKSLSRGDVVAARTAMERLAWLGKDGPARHTELGRRLAREGDPEAARLEFERSLALQPTSRAWQSLALLHDQRQEWKEAASAYDSAVALSPDDASLLFRAGRSWLAAGEPARAVAPLERARRLAPNEKVIALNLTRARREAGLAAGPARPE